MPDKTYKLVEIVGVSEESIQQAVRNALTKASRRCAASTGSRSAGFAAGCATTASRCSRCRSRSASACSTATSCTRGDDPASPPGRPGARPLRSGKAKRRARTRASGRRSAPWPETIEIFRERAAQLARRELTRTICGRDTPHSSPKRAGGRLRALASHARADRWVGITWPGEYGGRDAAIAEQIVYTEEMARAQAPPVVGSLGIGIAGPPLIAFGTEEQKGRFPHRILTAEDLWCFGFSEPGAGSDLASLRTMAVLDGDNFIVNGQKVWTTLAHHADWCMLLCRTDPTSKRAKGISCLLVDMKSPGVSVRPLRQIAGEAEFNEVFFENVHVPRPICSASCTTAGRSRRRRCRTSAAFSTSSRCRSCCKARDQLLELAHEHGAGADPILRQTLADLYWCGRGLPLHLPAHARQAAAHGHARSGGIDHQVALDGADPGHAADRHGHSRSARGCCTTRRARHAARAGQVDSADIGARAASIASGTSEIMRGIIAMQVLGLPRG